VGVRHDHLRLGLLPTLGEMVSVFYLLWVRRSRENIIANPLGFAAIESNGSDFCSSLLGLFE
jgi:hypothetical protein